MRRRLSLLLLLVMICNLTAFAVPGQSAQQWKIDALNRGVETGLFVRAQDMRPDDSMTRGEMAAVVGRAFGAKSQVDITNYTDVTAADWFYSDLQKAVAMKTLQGHDRMLQPNSPITRQEAFTVLGRAIGLSDKQPELAAFVDGDSTAVWAAPYVSALAKAGYVSGGDGYLNPQANISRGEFAALMDKIIKTYVNQSGTITQVDPGNIIVTAHDITMKNLTVKGDLIIADGVGDGDMTLDNVTVTGRVVVRGGGVNSVKIMGTSQVAAVVATRTDGPVRIVTSDDAKVENLRVDDGMNEVLVEGTFGTVEVQSPTPVTFNNAQVASIKATTENVTIVVSKGSTVENVVTSYANTMLNVSGTVNNIAATQEATGANLYVSETGTAGTITTAAPGTTLSNLGNVGSVGVTEEATGTTIVVGEHSTTGTIVSADKNNVTVDPANDAAKDKAEQATNDIQEKPVEPPKVDEGGQVVIPPSPPVDPPKPPSGGGDGDGDGGNPGPSALEITLKGEHFNTHRDADYSGVAVGYQVTGADVAKIKSVAIAIYQGETKLAENTSLAADKVNMENHYESAFIIKSDRDSTDDIWNFGSWSPSREAMPTRATVTIIDANGYTYKTEIAPLTQDTPLNPTWVSLFADVFTVVQLNTAIASAADGDTIRIASGTYELNSRVTFKDKSLTLIGEIDQSGAPSTIFTKGVSFDTSKTLFDILAGGLTPRVVRMSNLAVVNAPGVSGFQFYNDGRTGLENNGDDLLTVHLDNIKVDGAKYGVLVNGSIVNASNINIKNSAFRYAISVSPGSGVKSDSVLNLTDSVLEDDVQIIYEKNPLAAASADAIVHAVGYTEYTLSPTVKYWSNRPTEVDTTITAGGVTTHYASGVNALVMGNAGDMAVTNESVTPQQLAEKIKRLTAAKKATLVNKNITLHNRKNGYYAALAYKGQYQTLPGEGENVWLVSGENNFDMSNTGTQVFVGYSGESLAPIATVHTVDNEAGYGASDTILSDWTVDKTKEFVYIKAVPADPTASVSLGCNTAGATIVW